MKTKKKIPQKKKLVTRKRKYKKRETLDKGPLAPFKMLSSIVRCMENVEGMIKKTCTLALLEIGCPVAILGSDEASNKKALEQIERYHAAAQIKNAKINKDLN